MSKQQDGDLGEQTGCEFLRKQGYKILERNFRIKGGEIDIVAREGKVLVFVEVKTRWSHEYGPPVESMTGWKIRSLLKTAKFYIQKRNWGEKEYRLDFVGVDFAADTVSPKIELIKNITG